MINLQRKSSLVNTVYCQKQTSEERYSVKKRVLKDFVNFLATHLCWSLFLLKLQAWHLFWRTSANDCFCTALAPLTYFIFSSFFLIITAATVNIPDVCFRFKEFKSGISFSKSLSLLLLSFSISFLSFSVLFHFFLSLLVKRVLSSWELIKMFLPPLTSLKYVHVSK